MIKAIMTGTHESEAQRAEVNRLRNDTDSFADVRVASAINREQHIN